ncbi:YjhX family toxin [Roseisolibacter agri]|uniref:Uncharacterized protein n=1 Tax=Roseisolibacter agri TaxID=2014610 RepID=A0AA37Q2B6_9BACT|nr:YjhX family toxin [Roseisolibacter agri]GLC25089.1 hypothetical protein rosag_16020 [Roseisolibacter agri]
MPTRFRTEGLGRVSSKVLAVLAGGGRVESRRQYPSRPELTLLTDAGVRKGVVTAAALQQLVAQKVVEPKVLSPDAIDYRVTHAGRATLQQLRHAAARTRRAW